MRSRLKSRLFKYVQLEIFLILMKTNQLTARIIHLIATSRAIQVQPRGNNAGGSFFSDNVPRSSGSLPPAGNALPQSPKVDLGPPLSPDSGQLMRLRGGAGPWEGYVEVRGGKDRPWGHVCDAPDSWTIQEASVICRHLGFLR